MVIYLFFILEIKFNLLIFNATIPEVAYVLVGDTFGGTDLMSKKKRLKPA